MREHQIRNRSGGFYPEEHDEGTRSRSKAAEPPMRVTTTEELEQASDGMRRMVGQAAVRTGIAILAVPDPIPIIDEVAGITLVVGGTYLIATS
jgi:hypothetical protein